MSAPWPAAVRPVIDAFERLSRADLDRLHTLYTEDAWFKDPFNEVQGLAAVRGVYAHMFDALEAPRFEVLQAVGGDGEWFLTWNFHAGLPRWRREPLVIHGASHLQLAPDGRIRRHRDYWDAAEELYERLPAVGALMRWLKRRASG